MSDQMTIRNGMVTVMTQEGVTIERPESDLIKMIREDEAAPLNGAALPDGLKFSPICKRAHMMIVHQLPPQVRMLRWLARDSPRPYGPKATYRKIRISIPYSIVFAMFRCAEGRFQQIGFNELYFSNRPLASKKDTVGFPALLNVSCIRKPSRARAWICTQHLDLHPDVNWVVHLNAILRHVWDGGFNLSSEHHEGASWYGESEGVHPDLHPVERWQEATAKDDAFALSVDWKPSPLNVGEIIDHMFEDVLAKCEDEPQSLAGRFINYDRRQKMRQRRQSKLEAHKHLFAAQMKLLAQNKHLKTEEGSFHG